MSAEQIGQWILIGILVAFQAFDKAKRWFASKDEGKSLGLTNNPHPCAEHGERLATLEEAVREIKRDLEYIRNKLNGIT